MSIYFIIKILDYSENMQAYLDEFRLNMKYYREMQGVTQTQLSIICDCGTGTIGGIESGKAKPSFEMIIKIAEALHVHPAELFKRNSCKNKEVLKEQLQNRFKEILDSL